MKRVCVAPGCDRDVKAVGLCGTHYQRMKKRGELEPAHGNTGRLRPDLAARQKTHGLSSTSTYKTWLAMHRRCRVTRGKNFEWYGSKGINVCDRWLKFENFLADMGERPSRHHSIERKNSQLGYSRSNCIWATPTEQARNTSRNRKLTFNGKTQTLVEWEIETGIRAELIRGRIDRCGWSTEKALTIPTDLRRTGRYGVRRPTRVE